MIDYIKSTYSDSKENFYKLLAKNLNNNQKMFIITANPETFVVALGRKEVHDILLKTDVTVIPDGVGIVKSSRLIGFKIRERIPGIEVAEELLQIANKEQKKVYLFGAKEKVLVRLIKKLKSEYSGIDLVGYRNGYDYNRDVVFEEILQKQPDIILVALGIPNQELIINKYYHRFDKGVFVGVGGSFDVISGYIKRAPKILVKLNLEWLYRIIKQPFRIKKFCCNNIKFLVLISKIKLQQKLLNRGD
jgi:N-acetylglucosaminyldiphosphoundecaprenol N-acetyl-beta-D-mannosaminyltransferase